MANVKNSILLIAIFGLLLLTDLPCLGGEDAQEILEAADVLIRGEQSAFYDLTMAVEKPEWNMECALNLYIKGTEKAFGYFLLPPEDKDTAYLRIGYDMWTYVPHMRKTVQMPPAMMHQGIMGGNFSPYDLIRLTSISDIFIPVFSAKEAIDGEEMVVLELLPKEASTVTHGKLKMWIAKSGRIPFKIEYYNKKNELFKTLYYKKNKRMGGRIIPVVWEMVSAKDPSIRTVLSVSDAKFNIPMDDDVFTKKNLATLSKLPVTSAAILQKKNTDGVKGSGQ